jgi:hypothetical protein
LKAIVANTAQPTQTAAAIKNHLFFMGILKASGNEVCQSRGRRAPIKSRAHPFGRDINQAIHYFGNLQNFG